MCIEYERVGIFEKFNILLHKLGRKIGIRGIACVNEHAFVLLDPVGVGISEVNELDWSYWKRAQLLFFTWA